MASSGQMLDDWMNGYQGQGGAVPIEKLSSPPHLVVAAPAKWTNLEEQRAWAEEILIGITTAAVDGSHMAVSDTFDLEMAAIQVAWFVNRHQPGCSFKKQVQLDIRFSEDIAPSDHGSALDYSLERFTAEMERARQLVEELSGQDPPAVVFIDGTIIPSFAELMSAEERLRYIQPCVELLAASEQALVPVVAYIDRSWARDLLEALAAISGLKPKAPPVSDAQVLADILTQLGQRTTAFRCLRRGVLQNFRWKGRDYSSEVAFLYMRVNSGLPVRIEFPAWIVNAPPVPTGRGNISMVTYLSQIVLAEAIVGNGYPWPLASADAAAALTAQDRALFMQILQSEASAAGLYFSLPSKVVSKYHRRIW
jgi:hypothetical protein